VHNHLINDARPEAALVLADGAVFKGRSIGVSGMAVGEVVFNTAMTGYQEILTDPSYTGQIVTLTYPHIGNVGVNQDDVESSDVHVAGLVIRSESPVVSNWRGQRSLTEYLKQNGIVALAEVDTRRLTRILRTTGAQTGCIVAAAEGKLTDHEIAVAAKTAAEAPRMVGQELASKVSTTYRYEWGEGTWRMDNGLGRPGSFQPEDYPYSVVAWDFGVKENILRLMADRGIHVHVVPARTTFEEAMALHPDGIFLSNGPGDPEDVTPVIELIRALRGKYPIFGICLGHQMISLAYGAKTYKLKFGHRGGNHPVKNLLTGKIEITSQNHSYAVDKASVAGTGLEVTHVNLLDDTVEGVRCVRDRVFSVQYHPESAPGPQDSAYLFDEFIALMKEGN